MGTQVSTSFLPTVGFRNKLINGNFDFWQRGTSLTSAAAFRLLADRWICQSQGTTYTAAQQAFSAGQTDVPGEPVYFIRQAVTSVAGVNNFCNIVQKIENVRTSAGDQVTVSFYAKADAAKSIAVELVQDLTGMGSPVVRTYVGQAALTTAWKRFVFTATLPSLVGQTLGAASVSYLALQFWMDSGTNYQAYTGNLGQQSGTFDFARVQMEEGSVATDFEPRHPQQELAMCQRYCCAFSGTTASNTFGVGFSGTTSNYIHIAYPVPMRARATMSVSGPLADISCTTQGISVSATAMASGGGDSTTGYEAQFSGSGNPACAGVLARVGTLVTLIFSAEL